MNSIPLTFDERQINRVILGGSDFPPDVKLNVSVILLNSRGSQFRFPVLESLSKCGFKSIVSIENDPENFKIEMLSRRFPSVKFIIPLENATQGELINIAMGEVDSKHVLVVKDTLLLDREIFTSRIIERLAEKNLFCIAPRIFFPDCPNFPIVSFPTVENSIFKIAASSVLSDGCAVLFPFDFVGLYDREKFIQLGGFDCTIKSPYWQNADLSLRAWLFGEKIELSTLFSFTYNESVPETDVAKDISYSRFFLKNLIPCMDNDNVVIPKSSFLLYLLRSGCGFIESYRQFSAAKVWIQKNKHRFKIDVKFLIENWGKIQ